MKTEPMPCYRCGYEGNLKPMYKPELGRGYEVRCTNPDCNNYVFVIKKSGAREAAVREWNKHNEKEESRG